MQEQEVVSNGKLKVPFKKEIKKAAAAVTPTETLSSVSPGTALAIGLGVFSLVLGAAEVARTKRTAKISGVDKKYLPVVRAFGLREIVSGVGLLASKNKKPWLISRVVGDALDSAFLGYAYYNERRPDSRKKIVKAFLAISPIVLADVFAVTRAIRAK